MKISKIILGAVSFVSFLLSAFADEAKGYYFYDKQDYENVATSSKTPRGQKILNRIIAEIDERRIHSFEIPNSKTGREHSYVCDTHKCHLKFDWDRPTEHWCEFCKKYLKSAKYDAAWIKLLHSRNSRYLQNCMWAFMASGDAKYADYIKQMLLDYAKFYPTLPEPTPEAVARQYFLSRLYDQWLDDCVWLTVLAPAYMAAESSMTDEEKNFIKENLFKLLADQQMNRQGNNNWQVWNNTARIMLGVVLHDDSMIDIALNGKKGLLKAMDKEVNKDGWYNEASMGYHFFPLRGFTASANALRCRGINLFNDKLYLMYSSVVYATYFDLSVVSHNDGGHANSPMKQVSLYEFAYSRFKNPFLLEVLANIYTKKERDSAESLLNPIEIAPTKVPMKLESKLFPDTGFAILRSGKNAATLTYGESEGGHAHPHRLAITIHNGESEILPDFGTPGYGVPAYRAWYQKTLAHNTVVVDAKNQTMRKTGGKLIDFDSSSDSGEIEAFADKAYKGVEMSRKLELKGDILKDNFKCKSEEMHTYDYVLHFKDKPIFKANLQDAVLEDAPEYKLIRDLKKFSQKGVLKIASKSADVEITNILNSDYEVYVGTSDGPIIAGAKDESECWVTTVIIRTKAKDMNIFAKWKIK